MLADLHQGLTAQGDRQVRAQLDAAERLGATVSRELAATREGLAAFERAVSGALSTSRDLTLDRLKELAHGMHSRQDALRAELIEQMLTRLSEQARAEQELLLSTLKTISTQLAERVEGMSRSVDGRLEQISGKVNERLEEGFKKTNETFVSVMARLATIDEAQKKIDGLTSNVVSLQQLLGDKRSRGAFGEVQLEGLVRNILPAGSYVFQQTLSTRVRADCLLFLPPPTGTVAVDAKFPLENFQRLTDPALGEAERGQATRAFRSDLRAHIDAIADKYIIPGETSDGAVLFLPAEAVFAEVHAYHGEVVDYAMRRRVWLVSPTTLMAVLNTARAVLRDVETRRQIHIIKDELGKLGKEFGRFDERMKRLATHIRQAHEDAEQVAVTSQKISQRFSQIERAELAVESGETPALSAPEEEG
ncbi:MAG: DNA recombination protein RmuC [Burkholderiales bacterium]|nr:MAG: DNA recombination protein RmuC [Burkholderiales bacterium]